MAASDNTVTLTGNCTRDPELRFTPSGQAVATFGLAVNRRWQNRSTNEWEEQVSFFDVKCWAQMAENLVSSIHKGDRVLVSGRLEQRSWQTEGGDKRSKVEVVADEIAPSLRWATVEVHKNERRDASAPAGDGGGGRPVPNEPANGGYQNTASGGGYQSDEEPF